jgi:Holliday junction resolvasome RuvABC DNA-binding subunit
LALAIVRQVANVAQRSIIWGEVFSFLSNYRIRSYLDKNRIVDRNTAYALKEDCDNLVLALRNMGFNKIEAKEAAINALRDCRVDDTFEYKFRLALQYINDRVVSR